jgi:hypothetical protein
MKLLVSVLLWLVGPPKTDPDNETVARGFELGPVQKVTSTQATEARR